MEAHTFHAAKDALIAAFERRYVIALLARHEGNVSSAAREAGLSKRALFADEADRLGDALIHSLGLQFRPDGDPQFSRRSGSRSSGIRRLRERSRS